MAGQLSSPSIPPHIYFLYSTVLIVKISCPAWGPLNSQVWLMEKQQPQLQLIAH